MPISRERKAFVFEYKFVDEAAAPGEGYGSVFNNEDDGGDLILPGAFAGAIARHQAKSTMPKMLLNHGSMDGGLFGGADPMADLPVGCWNTMSEDSHGLQRQAHLWRDEGARVGWPVDRLHGRRIHPRHQAERAAPHHQDHQVAAGGLAGDVPGERAGTHWRGQDRRHPHGAGFRECAPRCARFPAKSIAQGDFKAAKGQPSQLDSFIASLRRQI
jgi:hypothetical protein